MTPLLLVASLVLGVASAATNREAFGAEPWPSNPPPRWGEDPAYSGGYETGWSNRDPQYPYPYRDSHYDPENGRYDGSPPSSPEAAEPGTRVERDDRAPAGRRQDPIARPDPLSGGTGMAAPQPEYRFRGDPPSGSNPWGGQDGSEGYRFRPLTGQEEERREQSPGWRPLDPNRRDRGGQAPAPAPPGLMDALTPPARTFGFEPRSWP
jgi:hypothetical protein